MNASALLRHPRVTRGHLRGFLLAVGVVLLALLLAVLPLPVAVGLVGGVSIVLLCLAQPLASERRHDAGWSVSAALHGGT